MRLYVCWGTFAHPGGHVHPCQRAFKALKDAGHDPLVIKSYGLRHLADMPFNQSYGRQTAKRLTGTTTVPVLVTDGGEVVNESAAIERWAQQHSSTETQPRVQPTTSCREPRKRHRPIQRAEDR